MVDYIEDASIAICMAGLLTALPNTQLTRRLERENRMFPEEWSQKKLREGGDQCLLGLNFETLRQRRDVLADYKSVIDRIYSPSAFFGRVSRAARQLDCFWPARKPVPGSKPPRRVLGLARGDWTALYRLLRAVMRRQPLLIGHYVKALLDCRRTNPGALQAVGTMAAFYLHLGPFSRVVSREMARQIAELDSDRWRSPATSRGTGTPHADGHVRDRFVA